jgi:hypothetical protein
MQSSLPQRQDHLRARYRALLESAWGRPATAFPDAPLPRARLEPPPLDLTRAIELGRPALAPRPGGLNV